MTMNLRPVSFAILSGALMIVGSSMAFANPDQTNPRESSLSTPRAAADAAACEAVSQAAPVSQDVTVTPDPNDRADLLDHAQHLLVRAAMQRSEQRSDAR